MSMIITLHALQMLVTASWNCFVTSVNMQRRDRAVELPSQYRKQQFGACLFLGYRKLEAVHSKNCANLQLLSL